MYSYIILFLRIFIKHWFEAASAINSPRNDLQLLKGIKKYEEFNDIISKKAMKKYLGYLWYLSEKLIAFPFFDEYVSPEIKRKMVGALQNKGMQYPLKCLSLDPDIVLKKNL